MTIRLMLLFLLSTSPMTTYATELKQKHNQWYLDGQATLMRNLAHTINTNTAKNIILVVSDGNGVGANYAARVWRGQQEGGYGDDYVMAYEQFPHMALAKTYTVNAMTPDSAGTMTAMMSGVKTDQGMIGVDETITRGDCLQDDATAKVTSFASVAKAMGKKIAIVSTARLTHATPAAVYAHSSDRDFEDDSALPEGCKQPDIAVQLIRKMLSGEVDVALGGGRRHFIDHTIIDEEGHAGKRQDGQNLIEQAQARGIQYVWNPTTLKAVDHSQPILGLFESSHMEYEADRVSDPSLKMMTKTAIKSIEQHPEGYFLMIEAGRVDHALHAANLARAVQDQNAMEKAVAWIVKNVDLTETLLIVTADHEHSIAFNGYCGRGSNILGFCMQVNKHGVKHTDKPLLGKDGKPYEVVSFTNGASSILQEVPEEEWYLDITAENLKQKLVWYGTRKTHELAEDFHEHHDHRQEALIPLNAETHSGEDVAIYSIGPWSHLLNGTIEQNVIFHVMHHAMKPELDLQ